MISVTPKAFIRTKYKKVWLGICAQVNNSGSANLTQKQRFIIEQTYKCASYDYNKAMGRYDLKKVYNKLNCVYNPIS